MSRHTPTIRKFPFRRLFMVIGGMCVVFMAGWVSYEFKTRITEQTQESETMDRENAFLHRLESIDESLKRIAKALEKLGDVEKTESIFEGLFGKNSLFSEKKK